jgi:hypothetical protein
VKLPGGTRPGRFVEIGAVERLRAENTNPATALDATLELLETALFSGP